MSGADHSTLIRAEQLTGETMKAVATINFKGGVGKTTITWLLAKMASEHGKRVLVVDADAQMSLTIALTVDEQRGTFVGNFGPWYEDQHKKRGRTLLNAIDAYDKFARGQTAHFDFPIDQRFIYQVNPNLDFIPSVDDLYWLELEVFLPENVKGFVNALLGRLEHSRHPYDVVFFDCPPSFTLLSYSVLTNCSVILVPTNPDVVASSGLRIMVEGLRNRIQPWPAPAIGVFMNKAGGRYSRSGVFNPYNETYTFQQDILREARRLSAQGTTVTPLQALIPMRADIRKAISFGGFPSDFLSEFQSLWNELSQLAQL
jgi:chromosome partitioning protein